jgi:DNA polymerase III subunit epsilon
MFHFTAIDFETACGNPNSICQVGLIRIENGIVAAELDILVRPPRNYYWRNFVNIHGISPERTAFAPEFSAIWPQIAPFILGQNVVAHNSSFDFNCLRHTLQHYHLQPPRFKGHCTLSIYKKGLAKLCAEHRIGLDHHNALSDARACATLFLKHLQEEQGNSGSLL